MFRAARGPLAFAMASVLVAEAGLVGLIAAVWQGVRRAEVMRYLFPTLTHDALIFVVPAVLLAAGIAVAAVLAAVRPLAGRAVLVQLCGVGAFVVLLLLGAFLFLLRDLQYNVWIGPPAWEGPVSALFAWGGMAAAAVALILPSTRRALAGPDDAAPAVAPVVALEDTGFTVPVAAAEPPRALLATPGRLGLAGGASLAAYALAVLGTGASNGVPALVVAGLLAALLAGGAGLACGAAVAARRGRWGAVVVARLAAGFMLLLQVVQLMRIVSAIGPGTGDRAVPLSLALLAASLTGIVLTLVGQAGLHDPAVRRHARSPALAAAPQFSWAGWNPPGTNPGPPWPAP